VTPPFLSRGFILDKKVRRQGPTARGMVHNNFIASCAAALTGKLDYRRTGAADVRQLMATLYRRRAAPPGQGNDG
jgi:hypothetical protein